MLDKLQEQLTHLQKREAKLTRDVSLLTKQVEDLGMRLERATRALRTGLPHMNLSEFFPDG